MLKHVVFLHDVKFEMQLDHELFGYSRIKERTKNNRFGDSRHSIGSGFLTQFKNKRRGFWETVENPSRKKVYLPKPRRVSLEKTYSRIYK